MAKFDNINELPFSSEQLTYLESEIRKFKVPLLYKIVFGSLYKWGKYFMPALFLIIVILGLFYEFGHYANLWPVMKGFAFFFIFVIGGLVVISHIWNYFKIKKECKRLGITMYQWNLIAIAFQIKYI